MGKKRSDTIKTGKSGTVRIPSDNTERFDKTEMLVSGDGTTKLGGREVIKSGFGDTLFIRKNNENLYKFNGKHYRLLSKISESTSEAQIFLIEREAQQFVLKLYYPFVKPKVDLIEKIRKFNHPDIIQVVDYGNFEGRFFEILDYADQGSLADNLPVTDIKLLKRYINEIIEALSYCHKNGIIHRDIKPSNIFLRDKNKKDILVGDFGIASLIDEGEQFRRTNIFQTPIYAAPEYRMNLRGETLITKAVDYYALGITIWELLLGEVPPKQIDDLEFLRLMFEGNPPLPPDMNDEIAHLIKGLTQRDFENRWGYEEVKQWLKNEPPTIKTKSKPEYSNRFDFGTDKKGNRLFASTPEDLAALINDDPETGRKHLYRGRLKEWLKEEGNDRLYIDIADITDYKFKENEVAGTDLAIFVLDKGFPYTGISGKSCKNKNDLISTLDGNITEYQKLLKNPNDKLYLYLFSKNAVDEVEKYQSYFGRFDQNIAIYYVIYDLRFSVEKNVPYYHSKNEETDINFKTLRDLADYLFDYPSEAAEIMKKNKFSVWLNFMNADIFEKFNDAVDKYTFDSETLPKLLPYILDPERGYKGIKGNMCYNHRDLGKEFDDHFHDYKKILKDKKASIYTFLEMKGYTGEVEYCLEVFNMENGSWRNSPYNDNIAMMKIIRAFDWTPVMYVSKLEDGKRVGKIANYKPEDLYKNRKQIKNGLEKELNNQDSVTIAWLSIFFHEYPLNDEKTVFMYGRNDFNERLKKFIEYFENYFPDTEIAKRNKEAKEKESKTKSKLLSAGRWNKVIYLGGMLLPFAAAIFLLTYSILSPSIYLPESVWSLSKWYFVIFIGSAFLYFISSDDNEMTFLPSLFAGGISGFILAAIIYFIFKLIVGTPLLLFLLLIVGAYFYQKYFSQIFEALKSYQAEDTFFINEEEFEGLVAQYTFNKIDDLEIQQAGDLGVLKKEIRYKTLFLIGYTAAVTFLLLGVLYLLLYHNPNF